MKNKNFLRPALVTGGILLVPLLGQWPWGVGDFVIMGILLMATGLMIEFVLTQVKGTNHRIAVVLTVLAAFFVIWAQLAVGLITKGFWGLECLADRGVSQLVDCANDVRRTEY
ncbi:MAG TPA: hypothetical protein VF209_01535 [Patescibacteria group bacterium]